MSDAPFETEIEFTLPRGFQDDEGTLHREGAMRLATTADEIKPLNDPRVQSNPSYLPVLVLSRTITRLGTLAEVTPHVIENLFVSDLAYLQDRYERINGRGTETVDAVCPDCGEELTIDIGSGKPIGEDEVASSETGGLPPRPAVRGGIFRRHWGEENLL